MTKKFYNKVTKRPSLMPDDALLADWPEYTDVQPDPLPPTGEDLKRLDFEMRNMRNAELLRTDHLMLPDMDTPDQALIDYRQALRDAPSTEGWPIVTPDISYKGDSKYLDKILNGERQ